MIKLMNLINESDNPYYKEYGNYMFGENPQFYGKVIEKDTNLEKKIQKLLQMWVNSDNIPQIIPIFNKLYNAKPYYPNILDPGKIDVYKGGYIDNISGMLNFINTTKFTKFNSEINKNLLISEQYFKYIPKFEAQSWSTSINTAYDFSFELNKNQKTCIMTTNTTQSKFLFKPFVFYYNLHEHLQDEGEKEIVGLENHNVQVILSELEYKRLING